MRLAKGNPGTFDAPKNSLEVALVAMRTRQIGIPRFLEELFNGNAYVLPLLKDLNGGDNGEFTLSQNPTLFCMTCPEYVALAIYTSPERAKPTFDLHPEFRFAAKVEAGDFLLGLTGRTGLVINPYWDVNMEWSDRQFAQIRAMMKRE